MEKAIYHFFVLILMSASFASADVVLMPSDRYNPWEESYPQSRFGAEPSQVNLKSRLPDPVQRSLASTSKEQNLFLIVKKGVQEVSLIVNELGFFPRAIFVTKDIPVRVFITSASNQKKLCVMIDEFNVRKSVKTDKIEEVTFTPTASGTYRLHCPVNNLEGNLIVRELASEP